MTIKVKICGLKTREAVEVADNNGADFLGFVFCEKSPRNITPIDAGKISQGVKAKKVAVVVDASDEMLAEIMKHLKPDYIQLHGNESDERISEIKNKYNIKSIKALDVNRHFVSENDPSHSKNRTPQQSREDGLYDFILFDSPGGGTGVQFDYEGFKSPIKIEWFLSGGLNAQNITEAVKITGAKMVDISSGVESTKGVKDLTKIKEFLELTKTLSN
jgi:phosphoribosylanthranilate isomerase